MKRCSIPVIFFHGEDDDFVPCDMSVRMYEACASAHKKLVKVPGAGHGVAYIIDKESYIQNVKEFDEECEVPATLSTKKCSNSSEKQPSISVKDVAKHITSFFKENGFTKNGNYFFKLDGCCLFIVSFEPCSEIRPGFFVYPLFYPFEFNALEFGSHIYCYRNCGVKDLNRKCSQSEFKGWISRLEAVLKNDVFVHFEKINSLPKLEEFLNCGYTFVRRYWNNTTPDSYFALKAYTDFLCDKKERMQKSIEQGIYHINDFPTSEHIKKERRDKSDVLIDMIEKPDEEKRKFVDGIVKNTLYECLGKNWESLIKDAVTFPVDFTNA